MKKQHTLKELNEYFYIKDSILYWKKENSNHKNSKIKKDDDVGCLWTTKRHKTSYLSCYFDGEHHRVHSLMYQIYHKLDFLPTNLVIDHIDRNGLNNKKENLRLVTQRENIINRGHQKNNTSGEPGITYYKRNNKWILRVSSCSNKSTQNYANFSKTT